MLGQIAEALELLGEPDQRVHDLHQRRGAGSMPHGFGRSDDRAHLHLVDLRPLQAEPAAARPEHRVRLLQLLDPPAHALVACLLERRQKLVQRRIEQPDRHGQACHCLEDRLEVALLHRQQLVERGTPPLLVGGEDHLAYDRQPLLRHEHVLGPAEADALRAELARLGRVIGRIRVRAHPQAPVLVAPGQDRLEVVVHLWRNQRHFSHDHGTRPSVDREHVPFRQGVTLKRDRSRIDVDRKCVAAGDARLAHPARDDRGVRRHPAVRGQHAGRVDQPVDVVGRGLPAHEDHLLARPAALLRRVGV